MIPLTDAEMQEDTKMDGTEEDDGWTVVKRHTKPRRWCRGSDWTMYCYICQLIC